MRRDIRQSKLFAEAEDLYRSVRQPGSGQICDAADVHVSPDGQHALFAGIIMDDLKGGTPTRVCKVDLRSGDVRVLTFGPHIDRLPKYSPNGSQFAFLSDRHEVGDFQFYLGDVSTGAVREAPPVEGWVEYLSWSPGGSKILLGVAGHGADTSGGQGAVTSARRSEHTPDWMPEVDAGAERFRWRQVWIYDVETRQVHRAGDAQTNIWEAVWCADDALVVISSPGPTEGMWYSASLQLVSLHTHSHRTLYKPTDQLGWPAASPSGKRVGAVEAVCSDRGLVAGELRIIDTASGQIERIDTNGIDISYLEWQSEDHLLLAGHRGFETVVGVYDAATGRVVAIWSSQEVTTGGYHVSVAGLKRWGDCVLVGEGFVRSPEIAVIRGGNYSTVRSFDVGYTEQVKAIREVEKISWSAPDGLALQGWLLKPAGPGPYPLVMSIHGGPVWHSRPVWLGRRAVSLLLIKQGYAVFLPNPRGSTGRGQDFARLVKGDMGGADTRDCLSGLDYLVVRGIADPRRLGVTGISYGGFMSAWLVTQDQRFSAAVCVAPMTNHVSEHLVSNIPHFVSLFLADQYNNPGGKYFTRSPIMHAYKVKTPTLTICGALDRCTPPIEAMQFHSALLENGATSVLAIYPQEGHGIRSFPAAIDYAARLVEWFDTHMPAR